MKKFEILGEFAKSDRHKMSDGGWENDANRVAQCRIATNFNL